MQPEPTALMRMLEDFGTACVADDLEGAGERIARYDAALREAIAAGGLDPAAMRQHHETLQALIASLVPRRDEAAQELSGFSRAGNAARAYLGA